MESMPTNDVFHHLCRLTGVYKDKELIVQLFLSQGVFDISKSKIRAWNFKTGEHKEGFREMPRATLDAFINALYERHKQSMDIDTVDEQVSSPPQVTSPLPVSPPVKKWAPRRTNTTGIPRLSLGHTKNANGYELLRYCVTIPAKNGQKRKTKSFYFGENRRQEDAFLEAISFLRQNNEFNGTDQDALKIFRELKH